jgi:hypothetical protein
LALVSAQPTPSKLGVPFKEHHVGERVRIALSRRDTTLHRRAFCNLLRFAELLL